MLARRQRAVRLDVEVIDAEQVVAVLELAALRVEAPAADVASLGDDHALGARLGHLNLGGHRVRLVLDADDRVLRQSPHAAEEELGVPTDQHRPPGQIRVQPFGAPVIERQHVVAGRLDQPQALQLVELLRHLLRQVVRLAPVLVGVVELPDVVVESRGLLADEEPGRLVPRHRGPALVVDAAVAEHLEILRLVSLGRLGVVEGVQHADAFDGTLLRRH